MAGLKAVGSELWFRPHPWALLAELTELIKNRCLTATPRRADQMALGQIFEEVAYQYGIEDGANDGWLVR